MCYLQLPTKVLTGISGAGEQAIYSTSKAVPLVMGMRSSIVADTRCCRAVNQMNDKLGHNVALTALWGFSSEDKFSLR